MCRREHRACAIPGWGCADPGGSSREDAVKKPLQDSPRAFQGKIELTCDLRMLYREQLATTVFSLNTWDAGKVRQMRGLWNRTGNS